MDIGLHNLRCLVLGGNGFIGANLCRALAASGLRVRSLSRHLPAACNSTLPEWHNHIEWMQGSFADVMLLRKSLRDVHVVFHLISSTLPSTSNDDVRFDLTSNVLPTLQLLEAVCHSGVRKVIFLSSGGTVYGQSACTPLAEDDPTNPICAYGIHKLLIEKYLGLFHRLRNVDHRVLRVSNAYGIGQSLARSQGVVAHFVHKAVLREPLKVWGDGTVIRDFIHITDIISAFLLVVRYEGSFRVFNIGSGTGHSLLQLISVIEAILGKSVEIRFQRARTLDVSANVLDIRRANSELNWRPTVSLADGVREMVSAEQTQSRCNRVV